MMKRTEIFTDRYGWYIGIAAMLLGGAAIVYIITHTTSMEAGHATLAMQELLLTGAYC